MKKLTPYIIIVIIIALIVALFLSLSSKQNMTVIYTGNISKKPINIVLHKFQDSDCGMVIDDISYSAQVVSPSGNTWFFHDHGGMVHWLSDKSFKDKAVIWVMTKDTKRYIDGKKAWYSRTDDTPMHYGFGAYEHKKNDLIDFKTMSLHMLRGENLTNPLIKKQLLNQQEK
jgi:hypothetical protein